MKKANPNSETAGPDARAVAFVDARLKASGVEIYPGTMPVSLHEAYSVQDAAIALWPDAIKGWKVGRITGDHEVRLKTDRLAGPVFATLCFTNDGSVFDMPVFTKGFAAIEGEVTAVIGKNAPEGKTDFTTQEALELIGSLHLGVEIASSPFSEINDHGPLVTISDFGNNYGLILSKEIPGWKDLALADWVFETCVNGTSVGKTAPLALPGGPIESVRFLLENTARRGMPLKAGMMVLTGAVTGVHQAFAGDTGYVTLGDDRIDVQLSELKF